MSPGYSAYAPPSLSGYSSLPQLSPLSPPSYPQYQSSYTMDSLNTLGSMAASASVCSAPSLGSFTASGSGPASLRGHQPASAATETERSYGASQFNLF